MSLTLMPTEKSPRWGAYGFTRSGRHRVNKSLYDAVQKAAELAKWGPVEWLQGGINDGAVAASASTHAGLDVGDIRTRGHSRAQIFRFVTRLMECGAIGFIRGVVDSMDPHIHAVGVPADQAHWEAWAQIYHPRYGYKYGGAGLAGAPWARWWGPPRKTLVAWEQSLHNPANKAGWYVVDPKKVRTRLVGRNSRGKVVAGSGRNPGQRIYIVRKTWGRLHPHKKRVRYAVTKAGVHYELSFLNRSQNQES